MIRIVPSVCLLACLSLTGCGGHTLDLDKPAITMTSNGGSTGSAGSANTAGVAGDGPAVETIPLDDSIVNFAADDERVYWLSSKSASRSCVYGQCAASVVTYDPKSGTLPMPAGDEVLFALTGGLNTTLVHCPKTGCVGVPQQFLREDQPILSALAENDFFYWVSGVDVVRCPLADCGEVPQLIAPRQQSAALIQIRESKVYFWGANSLEERVFSAPTDGSAAPTKLPIETSPRSTYDEFTVDSKNGYWLYVVSDPTRTAATLFQVRSCPLTGCGPAGPTIIVSDSSPKPGLTADDTGLYWIEAESDGRSYSSLHYCPSLGCPTGSKILAAGAVRNWTLSPHYVYWDEAYLTASHDLSEPAVDKIIHRIRKPGL